MKQPVAASQLRMKISAFQWNQRFSTYFHSSPAEIRAVLEAMPAGQRLFVLLIAVTGMRVGEALALRWTDFVSARSGIRVNHTLYRDTLKQPKTESSRRGPACRFSYPTSRFPPGAVEL